jgi:hypothetical protein
MSRDSTNLNRAARGQMWCPSTNTCQSPSTPCSCSGNCASTTCSITDASKCPRACARARGADCRRLCSDQTAGVPAGLFSCGNYSNCAECTADRACGWSENLQACGAGDSYGDRHARAACIACGLVHDMQGARGSRNAQVPAPTTTTKDAAPATAAAAPASAGAPPPRVHVRCCRRHARADWSAYHAALQRRSPSAPTSRTAPSARPSLPADGARTSSRVRLATPAVRRRL